jgi:prepilin-type N-terminal cleavage/methylation domain-containing protein
MKNIRNNDGFTLIELMIVVVIIGILAAIAIPRFSSVSDQAKKAEAGPIMKQVCSLAEAEFLKANLWPTALSAADVPGWVAPQQSRFIFTMSGGGANPSVAVATPDAANGGVVAWGTQEMNCLTKQPPV